MLIASMRAFTSITCFFLLALWASAQNPKEQPKTPPTAPGPNQPTETTVAAETQENEKIKALQALAASIVTQEAEKNAQRELLKKATSDDQRRELQAELDRMNEKIRETKATFASTATGINATEPQSTTQAPLNIQEELKNIFQPALRELREITAQPREIEALKTVLVDWTSRQKVAQNALAQIDLLLQEKPSAEVEKELQNTRKSWLKRLSEAESSITNATVQLAQRKRDAPSVLSLVTSMISHFWRNRGLSLLLALAAFVCSYIALHRGYRWFRQHSPIHQKYHDGLTSRIVDISVSALILLIALFAILLVLYVRNDWLLLTMASILILGLAWASRTALPPYFEQIRLFLNLGTVREGERIIYGGLPWRVDSLGFFCVLSNPDLNGATLRIPAKNLLSSFSRPSLPKEPWFPSRIDDWVILEDGFMGKVVQQTPEQVVLVKLGGSFKTYPTSSYLSKNPENITHQFSIASTFGLDYQYQSIATTEVPAIIQQKVYALLIEQFSKDDILSVAVEFASANTSSLDFRIVANVKGALAPQYNVIQRLLQRGAVEAANEHQWVIPFPQLTIHQPRR
jgi:small-conductance mechanosensitive channel